MDFDKLIGHIDIFSFLDFFHHQVKASFKEVQISTIKDLADAVSIAAWSVPKIVYLEGDKILQPKDLDKLFTKEMKERVEAELIALKLTRMVAMGKRINFRVSESNRNKIYVHSHEAQLAEDAVLIHGRMEHKDFYGIMSSWKRTSLEDKLVFVGLDQYVNDRNILSLYQQLDKL